MKEKILTAWFKWRWRFQDSRNGEIGANVAEIASSAAGRGIRTGQTVQYQFKWFVPSNKVDNNHDWIKFY